MELLIDWTDDCNGKKDYDGELVCISTRFWPSNYQKNGSCSAKCHVMMMDGGRSGESKDLIAQHFEGDSFDSVSSQVEEWAQTQADRVYKAILKEFWNE